MQDFAIHKAMETGPISDDLPIIDDDFPVVKQPEWRWQNKKNSEFLTHVVKPLS